MNKSAWILPLLAFVAALNWTACTDPTLVGAELLDDDRIAVGFTDSVTVSARTFYRDSVAVYTPNFTISRFLLGNYIDPYFGNVRTDFYTALRMPRAGDGTIDKPPVEDGLRFIDSVVLLLPINESLNYGTIDGDALLIDIFPLLDTLPRSQTLYSDGMYPFDPMSLTVSGPLNPRDSLPVLVYSNLSTPPDTVDSQNQLRIQLDPMLGTRFINDFLADSTIFENDSTLLNYFPGLYVTINEMTDGLLGLDILDPNVGLILYGPGDNFYIQYRFPLTTRVSRYAHDRAGYPVDAFVNGVAPTDSLFFLQGLDGAMVELELENIDSLAGKILNKAELELTVIDLPGDDLSLTPPEQLALFIRTDAGDYVLIEDALFSQAIDNNSLLFFGGDLEDDGNGTRTYRMNLTLQLSNILDGSAENRLYLGVFQPAGNARRVVVGGPAHPEFPLKLRVAFTDL